ncbi:MAG: diaminobutyrate acetyltransferase [Alphaproteobacteria bacterium]
MEPALNKGSGSAGEPVPAGFWTAPDGSRYRFRMPTVADGAALWTLVHEIGTLEPNSAYCYLLLGAHFAETCVLAEHAGAPVGFVAAFRSPVQPEVVFVWQIGVREDARGRGVARELLRRLLERPACAGVRFLEATVTPSNHSSAALFRGLARHLGVPCSVTPGFPSDLFPEGAHEREDLYRIGPLSRKSKKREEKGNKG